jgi:hypothetical protein
VPSDLNKKIERVFELIISGKKNAIVENSLVEIKEEVSEPQPEEAHHPHSQVFVHAEEVEFKD